MLLPACLCCGSIASAEEESAAYGMFRSGAMDARILVEVLPMMADAERRPEIRTAILDAEQPPVGDLVTLLEFPALAVRLGSLELLEEMAGGDFSFNPWAAPESAENQAALARWKAWAGAKDRGGRKGVVFSDDQRRGYLRDLLGEDADKSARARRMLEAEGMSAIGFLETHLAQTPGLPPGSRSRIREAQYQIALSRQLGDQASLVARQLAFGSRDQMLSALSIVRDAGMFAIPILADFIGHPDALVRETAIDSLLASAGEKAVPIVGPLLVEEKDVNVIHGAMRRLKEIRSLETEKLVARFLTHPDEDLLVSAIQTSLTLSGDNDRYSFGEKKAKKPPEADEAILKCLADPRWRVRAVALEYVAKRKLSAAKDASLSLLDDPDPFVRFAAIQAVVALGYKEALPRLKQLLMESSEAAGPVIEGYAGIGSSPDDEMLAKIDTYPADARMAVIQAASSRERMSKLLLRYVGDPDLDVACAALRAIASSEELLKQDNYSSVIVLALRENSPEKISAILERLSLPTERSSHMGSSMMAMLMGNLFRPDGPTSLDPLYEAFEEPAGSATSTAPKGPKPPKIANAQREILKELARLSTPDTPAALRFNAALNLARAGDTTGISTLLRDLPTLTTAQKTNICDALENASGKEFETLIRTLLADPVSEVRAGAAECALSSGGTLIDPVLEALVGEGALLQPEDAYGYRFEYAARENPGIFRPWALKVLNNPSASAPLVVLACTAARHGANADVIAALTARTTSESPLIRRAAWHSLLTARPSEISAHAKAIAEDPEAFVRAVLPDRISKPHYVWEHRFSDTRVSQDNHYDHNSRKVTTDEATRTLLARLAEADPAPLVRFEAGLALLQQGGSINLDAFVRLIPKLSRETRAPSRVKDWLEENASRATPALRPLLAVVDLTGMDAKKRKVLEQRISPQQEEGLISFASLAAMEEGAGDGKDAPLLDKPAPSEEPVARTSLDVVYFYKPGCAECTKTRQYLDALARDFPLLRVEEFNILDADSLVRNQSLCAWFDAPSTRYNVAPAVFTQTGFVIGPEVSPVSLGTLFGKTMAEPQDDAWRQLTETREAEAVAAVEENYGKNITLPIVLAGGLLDGINPCAFATIIFFLSYLQIARRSPREMLMVGAAFISAVFIAYFAAGLVLYQVLDSLIARFAGVRVWMNYLFGALALVAAWLSFRDALRARAGRLDEMTLQLPGMLKDRIRGVIRSGARARRFVVAAFLAGIVISFLELACTGQVYAPIIYQIQKGRMDAVLMLAAYNLAFVTPLVVIFLLAWSGLRSESLIAFQKKHTFGVKLALALLFIALAAVILLGDRLL